MIKTKITRKGPGSIEAFTVENHGDSYVCSAVSMLVINTINSIETLTPQHFDCDYDESGGYIRFSLKGPNDSGAELLLESMLLGLTHVQEQYPSEIELKIR